MINFDYRSDARRAFVARMTACARLTDEALDAAYGYGRAVEGYNFGWLSNCESVRYALVALRVTPDMSIEKLAAEVHQGWSDLVWDDATCYLFDTPTAKIGARTVLADTPYVDLTEEEKEKDRVVARVISRFVADEASAEYRLTKDQV